MNAKFYSKFPIVYGYLFILMLSVLNDISAQINMGRVSGGLMTNTNFFIRDSSIGADNTPQYDRQLIGSESWLNVTYNLNKFEAGIRFDIFQNSNLLNPEDSYSDQGIGRWYVKQRMKKFTISGGYLYDQIGSGIIFRAYEDRTQLIDNALYGLSMAYDIKEDWKIKAFTGKQKNLFETYDTHLRGLSLEGFLADSNGVWTLAPGVGFVNRTFDTKVVESLANIIGGYQKEDLIIPSYNTYLFSFYNTLSYKNLSWYVEVATKSEDVFYNQFEKRKLITGETVDGKLIKAPGLVFYTSLGYAAKGFGVTVDYKRTENFDFRTNPNLSGNLGQIGFIPAMSRVNSYRLTARYAAATQFIGEQAYQIDLRYKLNKKWSFNVNYSNITDLDNQLLYSEIYTEAQFKMKRKWQILGGVQLMDYNIDVYQGKPGKDNVKSIVPYFEWLYKFTRKKSMRVEGQYMFTEQDLGQWVFGLVEIGVAPHWLIEISGMYNVISLKSEDDSSLPKDLAKQFHDKGRKLYPTFGAVYTQGAHRIALRYVKQVEGVVCSGGICRFEPAFSGVKLNISSTF